MFCVIFEELLVGYSIMDNVPFIFSKNFSSDIYISMFPNEAVSDPIYLKNIKDLTSITKKSKYIIVEEKMNDIRIKSGVIFPDYFTHKNVFQKLKSYRETYQIFSAGFLHVYDEVICIGESISLRVSSNPNDSKFFESQMKGTKNDQNQN